MIKEFQILICTVLLFSCNQNSENELNSAAPLNQKKTDTKQLSFGDLIPEHLSDSSKLLILKDWVNKIDLDTSLICEKYSDTSGSNIEAFFRNDTLVRIIRGDYPGMDGGIKYFDRYKFVSYYFHKDTLIQSIYKCSSYQQTGSCSPVSETLIRYYYKDRVFHENHIDEIGDFYSCGCGMSYTRMKHLMPEEVSVSQLDYIAKEIKRLKEIIN